MGIENGKICSEVKDNLFGSAVPAEITRHWIFTERDYLLVLADTYLKQWEWEVAWHGIEIEASCWKTEIECGSEKSTILSVHSPVSRLSVGRWCDRAAVHPTNVNSGKSIYSYP